MEVEESEAEMPKRGRREREDRSSSAPLSGPKSSRAPQDFFWRGNGNRSMHCTEDSGDDGVFATPGKPVMKGALARSLSAAASSPQQVGSAETLSGAQPVGEGEAGMEGSKEVEGMNVAEDGWRTEGDNPDEGAISVVSTSDGLTTPAPTGQVGNPDPDPGHADHGEQENGRRGGYAAAHQDNAALGSR